MRKSYIVASLQKIIDGIEIGIITENDYGKMPLTRQSLQEMVLDVRRKTLANKKAWEYSSPSIDSDLRKGVAQSTTEQLDASHIFIKPPFKDCVGKIIYASDEFVYVEPVGEEHKDKKGVLSIYAVPRSDPERTKKLNSEETLASAAYDLRELNKLGPVSNGDVVAIEMVGKQNYPGSVTLAPFKRTLESGENLTGPFMPGLDSNGKQYVVCHAVPAAMPVTGAASNAGDQEVKTICKVYQEDLKGTTTTIDALIDWINKNKGTPWEQWKSNEAIIVPIASSTQSRRHVGNEGLLQDLHNLLNKFGISSESINKRTAPTNLLAESSIATDCVDAVEKITRQKMAFAADLDKILKDRGANWEGVVYNLGALNLSNDLKLVATEEFTAIKTKAPTTTFDAAKALTNLLRLIRTVKIASLPSGTAATENEQSKTQAPKRTLQKFDTTDYEVCNKVRGEGRWEPALVISKEKTKFNVLHVYGQGDTVEAVLFQLAGSPSKMLKLKQESIPDDVKASLVKVIGEHLIENEHDICVEFQAKRLEPERKRKSSTQMK